ncbi:MAG: 3'-5' exonuclease domain-containing protein 2 [Crocinitomix sp.]|nr:3'-5' exonuclease domain-containing protein 2 [Crocinitomix sp.]|tara:strand:- start:351 stop:944 length:594 start_codon:yes stop_codon:yes gene_type:complete
MFKPNITKEAINELPLDRYEGEIVLVDKTEDVKNAFDEINQHKFVGFDTETKPVFVKGQSNEVALLQIGIPDKVFLMRINLTGITTEIISFFENGGIKKLGVGLRDDIIFLQRITPFEADGFVELNEMVNEINIEANGLRKLTAIILGFRISKNAQVSNWEAKVLNPKQQRYAATDAWVCLEMYNKLRAHNQVKAPK